MDIIVENARSQLIALEALTRLRDAFNIVSLFLEDPRRSIRAAHQLRTHEEHQQMKSLSGPLERHKAEQSLLLGVTRCLAVSRQLNETTKGAITFDPKSEGADGDHLLKEVLTTGQKAEACIAFVSNALNVIKGREKRLQTPLTPAL